MRRRREIIGASKGGKLRPSKAASTDCTVRHDLAKRLRVDSSTVLNAAL